MSSETIWLLDAVLFNEEVNRVLRRAREVVGVGRAFRFVYRGNAAFDGAAPIYLIRRGRVELVMDLLDAMAAHPSTWNLKGDND
jgi:hypothetical protein